MHVAILWCGFLGAWLLVLGPVYQAMLELTEEDEQVDRVRASMSTIEQPRPVPWWLWLLPPIALALRHRRGEAVKRALFEQLPPDQFVTLTNYVNKAAGWLFVASGGVLIALKETYELVEHYEWPIAVFWVLSAGMLIVAVSYPAARQRRTEKLQTARAS